MTKQLIIDEYGNIKLVHEYKILKQEDLLSEASILFPYIIHKGGFNYAHNNGYKRIPYYGFVDSKSIVSLIRTNEILLKTYYTGLDNDTYYPTFNPGDKESVMMDINYKSFIEGFQFIYLIEHHSDKQSLWDNDGPLAVKIYYGNENEIYLLPLPNTFEQDNRICLGVKEGLPQFQIQTIYNHLQKSIWNLDLITEDKKDKAKSLFALDKRKTKEPTQKYQGISNAYTVDDLKSYLIKPKKVDEDKIKRLIKILNNNENTKKDNPKEEND